MAGGIKIPPYQPLGVRTEAVPGGGYIQVNRGGLENLDRAISGVCA